MKRIQLNKILLRTLIATIVILLPIQLLQYSVAQSLSFGYAPFDNLLYYGSITTSVFIILLLLVLIFIKSKKNFISFLSGLASMVMLLIFLPLFIIQFGIMFDSEKIYKREYFFTKDGYNYYLRSERFFATMGTELEIHREKPIFLFIKSRNTVTEAELKKYGVNIDSVEANYLIKYF
ncbi:MAG: hypothetical protein WCS69_16185 [Ignavibacteriaceae bacterium]|jgi:hypothetical protein